MNDKCRLPGCVDELGSNGHFCDTCLTVSIRRFMQYEGSWTATKTPSDYQRERANYWYRFLLDNADEIVRKETEVIKERGFDYNRDTLKDDS